MVNTWFLDIQSNMLNYGLARADHGQAIMADHGQATLADHGQATMVWPFLIMVSSIFYCKMTVVNHGQFLMCRQLNENALFRQNY